MHLSSGFLLQCGKYRIESVLGQGGFGITYLAEQTGLERKVAIKEFFMRDVCNREPDTSYVSVPSQGSRELVERFLVKFIKEARMIAAMDDRHIINIYDVFEENGTAYYVMEYLNGGSLNAVIPAGGFSESVALGYIRQIADALRYIHEEKHVLHLDVKPSNVLLRKNGDLVLIDFGISKHYDNDGGFQTSSSPVGVSRGYAPLEQYNSGGLSHFSAATDVYSLGAVLYCLLTGQTPPDANIVLNAGLPGISSAVSDHVKTAVRTAMQPRRPDRPQSVGEFMEMLDAGKIQCHATHPSMPKAANPDATVLASSVIEEVSDKDFLKNYNRLVATQRYMDALDLCIYKAKDCEDARQILPGVLKTYLKKCGNTVLLPTFTGISYEWLTDLLISNGYKKMSMSNMLKVDNVTFELLSLSDGVRVRIINKYTFTMFIKRLMLAFLVFFFAGSYVASIMNYSDPVYYYGDGHWHHYYRQIFGGECSSPDPLYILVCILSLCVCFLCILWGRKIRTRKFKAIREVVLNALMEKWIN